MVLTGLVFVPFFLQVSVLNYKEHEVTVEARISTTNARPAQQHEEAVSCGDFFVAVGGDDACSNWFYQI